MALTPNTKIEFNQSECTIEFHTATNMITVQNEIAATGKLTETRSGWHSGFNNSMLSCTTEKTMASPFGVFSITLAHVRDKDGKSWLDVVKPLDMVVIRMASAATVADGEKYVPIPVMVGVVEGIRKSSTYDGSPNQTIVIDGSDFGKLMYDYKIYYRYFFDIKAIAGKNNARGIQPVGPVWKILSELYQLEFLSRSWLKFRYKTETTGTAVTAKQLSDANHGVGKDFITPGETPNDQQKYLDDIMAGTFKLSEMMGFSLGYSDGYVPGLDGLEIPENPVWSALEFYANTDFHEIFFDLIDMSKLQGKNSYSQHPESQWGKAHKLRMPLMVIDNKYVLMLIHRPKPFISRYGDSVVKCPTDTSLDITSLHYNLPFVMLKDSWIKSEDISVTSHEVYNHFGTSSSFLQSATNGSSTSDSAINILTREEILNINSIYRYGQRKLVASTNLFPKTLYDDMELVQQKKIVDSKTGKVTLTSATEKRKATDAAAADEKSIEEFIRMSNEKLHDWYIYNDEYRTGQLELQGNPNIKIGIVVKQKEGGWGGEKLWNYYVQSVTHSFVRYSHFTTTVSVVRGFDENEMLPINKVGSSNHELFLDVTPGYVKWTADGTAVSVKKHSVEGFSALKLEKQRDFDSNGHMSALQLAQKDLSKKQDLIPFPNKQKDTSKVDNEIVQLKIDMMRRQNIASLTNVQFNNNTLVSEQSYTPVDSGFQTYIEAKKHILAADRGTQKPIDLAAPLAFKGKAGTI